VNRACRMSNTVRCLQVATVKRLLECWKLLQAIHRLGDRLFDYLDLTSTSTEAIIPYLVTLVDSEKMVLVNHQ
jgi:hypothetical protein